MIGSPAVPLRLLRDAVAYRTLGGGQGVRVGVGFLLKSGRPVDMPWRQAGPYSAVWCLRGAGTYLDAQRQPHAVRPGMLFHRFNDRPHGNNLDPGGHWAEAFILLPDGFAASLMAAGVIDPRRPVVNPGIDLSLLDDLDRLRDELVRAHESGLPGLLARATGLLVEILARGGSGGDAPRRRLIDEACRRLAEEPRCDLHRLARDLGLGYERFRKIFRDATGVAPAAYRIRRRVDRARRLLVDSDRPLADLAAELGYPNPFAFSVQFKQVVGESPEAYRRRH